MTRSVRMPETDDGQILFNVPFPGELDEAALASLKTMRPIIVKQPYSIDYIHSYGQDSPWFAALANATLLGCQDPETGYTYATPRGHDMYSGNETNWVVLPTTATLHAFTVCHFGSEEFLAQTPFILGLMAFAGGDTLLLSRVLGLDPNAPTLDWIGQQFEARFLRNSKFKPTDVYFVPVA